MSGAASREIRDEFLKSKMGMVGISILATLIIISVVAVIAIPVETFQEWNNPQSWISYPKVAVPAWTNLFLVEKAPEHLILDSPDTGSIIGDVSLVTSSFAFDYIYDGFPNDFIYEFSAEYSGSPLLQMYVLRPDGIRMDILSSSLPYLEARTTHTERVFSTDYSIKKNIAMQSDTFGFDLERLPPEELLFSYTDYNEPLKGRYVFVANIYHTGDGIKVSDSRLIIGGKAFGVMGTDELRRDLAVGLLWGTPLALFIGLVVAIASVVMGLLYGVYAGYRGKKTDETMMRFNDVIYALPALPFLIILSITISNSIFVMAGFLMVFGWVGVAKVSRSMSLQIKTRGYVDAAGMMGQKDSKIILKHILPQLLPYAFASIAISVPAAITTEAGLSFLGLGDPSFPTWGQILHDADTYGAGARGLWWWIMPPGVMIALTGLAFVFIGNALDAIVNPRLKR
ncbi:MAG: ABC transporter permease [Nitrosopumilus sp. B06]|nr:MAG: ABC transporter permease [Nitrosopumilus sp. D6]RNJ78871.1 MAG: ABC transporter permease [Nitrosopumilus sp. B06]